MPRTVRTYGAETATAVSRAERVVGVKRFLFRSGERESHGRSLPYGVRTSVLVPRSADDAGPEISLAENCGRAFRRWYLRARGDSGGCVLSEHPARTVDSHAAPHHGSSQLRLERPADDRFGPAGECRGRDREDPEA